MRGVSAWPAPVPPLPLGAGFPPVLEHDASVIDATATAAVLTQRRCGPRCNFMNSPSRMKLDTAKAVGCRWSCFDVIRITRRSQYFVRTLGLQVKFWDTLPTIAGSRIGT